MKLRIGIALAAQLLTAGAHAQSLHSIARDPSVSLVWRKKPSGDDMAAAYPPKAQREAKAGWAVIECQTALTGDLKDCQVLGEAPADYGFGAAALKLAPKFKLDTDKSDPVDLNGGVVAIPIVMLTPTGAPLPSRDYLAGDPSALLTPTPKGSAACPTPTAPAQTCSVHRFTWAARPYLEETAALVRAASAVPATTTVLCPIGANLKLSRCTLAEAAEPSQIAAVTGLIPMFTAPAQADDKTTTQGGFALVQFNWTALKRAVETSVLTKAP